ncbi:MAG: hypothetical protein GC157_01180 [Frankiales bacterium]|nr:hypothetical protein [Frankiales bacterium]
MTGHNFVRASCPIGMPAEEHSALTATAAEFSEKRKAPPAQPAAPEPAPEPDDLDEALAAIEDEHRD